MSQLLIRPGHNDHRLVESVLAPGGVVKNLRPVIGQLVLDAPLAASQPLFAAAAQNSGTPVLIDPLTFLLQTEVDPSDSWSKLPFAIAREVELDTWQDLSFQDHLVKETVRFQLEHGATSIIPPYPLIGDDSDLVDVAIDLMRRTRKWLSKDGTRMPLVPVLCLSRPRRVSDVPWHKRLQILTAGAQEVRAGSVALAISGTGSADDSYDAVHTVVSGTRYVAQQDLRVVAWRQGLLGPAAVAAGATGYECGIGSRERCDVRGLQQRRKPRLKKGSGGAPPGIYIELLGRSLPRKLFEKLAQDRQVQARLVCTDHACCPDGLDSTLADSRRHAIVSRARGLSELDAMPSSAWRLNAIAREAERGALLAELATKTLQEAGSTDRVQAKALNSIASVADFMRQEGDQVA